MIIDRQLRRSIAWEAILLGKTEASVATEHYVSAMGLTKANGGDYGGRWMTGLAEKVVHHALGRPTLWSRIVEAALAEFSACRAPAEVRTRLPWSSAPPQPAGALAG